LTQDVCRERGVQVDAAGFDAAMARQKDQARAAGKFKMDRALEYAGASNVFVGYEHLSQAATVVALYADGSPVTQLDAGQLGVVVLDRTPFYSESGGQVGDAGVLTAAGIAFEVEDTQKNQSGCVWSPWHPHGWAFDDWSIAGCTSRWRTACGDRAESLGHAPDAQSLA